MLSLLDDEGKETLLDDEGNDSTDPPPSEFDSAGVAAFTGTLREGTRFADAAAEASSLATGSSAARGMRTSTSAGSFMRCGGVEGGEECAMM